MKLLALAGLLAAAALLLVGAGCGSDEPSTDEGTATAPFDRAFIDAMVPHHEQAIEMSRSALDEGLREPILVDIANSIVETQRDEIEQMTRWREEWFGSSRIAPDGAEQLGVSLEDMGMSEETMDFSKTPDVDEAFATMMIAHHEGAIMMAELAADRAERPEIKELASSIIEAQRSEIEDLRPYASADGDDGMPGMDGMNG